MSPRLPPTDPRLSQDDTRPYFIWWHDITVGQFRQRLRSDDVAERAYWMGALLREANSRDVWLYVTPAEIRAAWPHLIRHLGRARQMWAYLLGMGPTRWPPTEAYDA